MPQKKTASNDLAIKENQITFLDWIGNENTSELIRTDVFTVHVNIVSYSIF